MTISGMKNGDHEACSLWLDRADAFVRRLIYDAKSKLEIVDSFNKFSKN